MGNLKIHFLPVSISIILLVCCLLMTCVDVWKFISFPCVALFSILFGAIEFVEALNSDRCFCNLHEILGWGSEPTDKDSNFSGSSLKQPHQQLQKKNFLYAGKNRFFLLRRRVLTQKRDRSKKLQQSLGLTHKKKNIANLLGIFHPTRIILCLFVVQSIFKF